jgi:L-lactate dehydrogenase complex protein LldG
MSAREAILTKIRRALAVPAPKRSAAGHSTQHNENVTQFTVVLPMSGEARREWLPPVGESWEEQLLLFEKNAIDLRAEFVLCADRPMLADQLNKLAVSSGWNKIAAHRGELVDLATQALSLPVLIAESRYNVSDLERCDASITECDALIAQTGSVLITNRSAGGRSLSALSPHHVVMARKDQLVPDLLTAFALVQERYGSNYPTLISFITGPSRTGDIERILVLGAHGPKRLTIFCI